MRKEKCSSVAHESSLLKRLSCCVNEQDSQDLVVGLIRCVDQLISMLVCLPMLGGDQSSDRRRTKGVRGSVELLDHACHAQQHSGPRI